MTRTVHSSKHVEHPRRTGDFGVSLVELAQMGAVEACRRQLASGVDPNLPFHDGSRAINAAVSAGHASVVRLLIAARAEMDHKVGGITPLMDAAASGHDELVTMLAQAGADLQATDDDGNQAHHLAAMFCRASTFVLLLRLGANPGAMTDAGLTPIAIVCSQCISEEFDRRASRLIEVMVQIGCDVEGADGAGRRPLHLAVSNNCALRVHALLRGGANANATDAEGVSPMRLARQLGFGELAALMDCMSSGVGSA